MVMKKQVAERKHIIQREAIVQLLLRDERNTQDRRHWINLKDSKDRRDGETRYNIDKMTVEIVETEEAIKKCSRSAAKKRYQRQEFVETGFQGQKRCLRQRRWLRQKNCQKEKRWYRRKRWQKEYLELLEIKKRTLQIETIVEVEGIVETNEIAETEVVEEIKDILEGKVSGVKKDAKDRSKRDCRDGRGGIVERERHSRDIKSWQKEKWCKDRRDSTDKKSRYRNVGKEHRDDENNENGWQV